jgi:hypothetical protein
MMNESLALVNCCVTKYHIDFKAVFPSISVNESGDEKGRQLGEAQPYPAIALVEEDRNPLSSPFSSTDPPLRRRAVAVNFPNVKVIQCNRAYNDLSAAKGKAGA